MKKRVTVGVIKLVQKLFEIAAQAYTFLKKIVRTALVKKLERFLRLGIIFHY